MPITPDSSFIPLASGLAIPERPKAGNAGARDEGATSFRPLGQAGAAPAPGADFRHEPRVSLQRDGDRVTGIRIQCTCGQMIELACLYEAPPPAANDAPAPALPVPPPAPAAAPDIVSGPAIASGTPAGPVDESDDAPQAEPAPVASPAASHSKPRTASRASARRPSAKRPKARRR